MVNSRPALGCDTRARGIRTGKSLKNFDGDREPTVTPKKSAGACGISPQRRDRLLRRWVSCVGEPTRVQ